MLAGIERRLREALGLRVQALVSRDHRGQVESYFDSVSSDWAEIYSTESVLGVIQQRRKAIVLEWIEELALPRESRILEVGCGAGFATIELARRGYTVYATNSSKAMVERTLRGVIESDVGDRVEVFRGDACSLPFEDDMFTLAFAMGVISWLESPDVAVPGVPLEYAEWPETTLCKEPTRAERMVGFVTCAALRDRYASAPILRLSCLPAGALRRARKTPPCGAAVA